MKKNNYNNKTAQQELKTAKAFLDRIINLSPFPMWVSDAKGTVIKSNKALRTALKVTNKQIIGKYNIFKDKNLRNQGVLAKVETVFKKKKPVRVVLAWKAAKAGTSLKGARDVIIDVSVFPIVNAVGKLTNFVCQWVDITEHIYMQEALKESEARFRNLFEKSRDGFVMVDKKGRITDANPAFCKMLGYSLGQLRKIKDFYQITPKKWIAWEKREIWNKRLLKEGYSGLYEKEYIHKNGTIFPVELQSYVVFDEKGKINYLWGICRDVTARKKAELQLQENEQKFRSYIDNAPDGIFVADEKGRYIDVNNEACSITGYSRKELLSMSIPDLLPDHAKKAGYDSFNRLLQHGRMHAELQYLTKQGEVRYWSVDGTKVSGNRYLGFVSDITSRKKMEKEVGQEKHRLEKINEIMFKRENRVLEIKKEVNKLLKELGRKPKYHE